VKAWHWLAASVALEGMAGAAMLAYYRSKALARGDKLWDSVLTGNPETVEGAKDGVSGDKR
jgi:hypothetical protein